jgi:hypothetical protein
MKRITMIIGAVITAFSGSVMAQPDNDDINIATHALNVTVPEVALLDLYDNNAGINTEASTIVMDMGEVTLVGTNAEAGLYAFEDMSYTDLFLNYTSVTGAAGSGFDVTRQIDVQFEAGSTFPGNLDLRITPEVPNIIAEGGTPESAGTITAGGVALGTTTPVGTNALLVSGIESVYTGDEAYGVRLTYTLEQNGNFAGYQAGIYNATLRYTLSDL